MSHDMQPAERSGAALLYVITDVTAGYSAECSSAYQNRTHFPDCTANHYPECRVVAVYPLSFTHFGSQFGAAGGAKLHTCSTAPNNFPPTVLSRSNQLKVFLCLIHSTPTSNRKRAEGDKKMGCERWGVTNHHLPLCSKVHSCNDQGHHGEKRPHFPLQSPSRSLHYESCHNWAMACRHMLLHFQWPLPSTYHRLDTTKQKGAWRFLSPTAYTHVIITGWQEGWLET